MSVLIEIVVGAVLSVFVTTGEVDQDHTPEKVRSEQVAEISAPEDCID